MMIEEVHVRLLTTVAGLRCYLAKMAQSALGGISASSTFSPASPPNRVAPSVGFVPTMGALHEGHVSLIRRARLENTIVVVSIFVNPLQFGPQEDFSRYPRDLETDRQICQDAGVDVLFAPTVEEMDLAPEGGMLSQVVPPPELCSTLCGLHRPGHFQGVATIVAKLLHLVQPQRAYFGQKDAQQLAILQRMVKDLNWPLEIVACPILRQPDGLAMSSRNRYLKPEEKVQALALYQSLLKAERLFRQGERSCAVLCQAVAQELDREPALKVEYVELVDPDSLRPLERVEVRGLLAIAARLGAARLIDNVILNNRLPIIAIDGPAGAGKSTVTRRVAEQLGLLYLDTGAMYRAVTWEVLRAGIDPADEVAIAELVSHSRIDLVQVEADLRVHCNQQDVTPFIRRTEVTEIVSRIAALAAVRHKLVKIQRYYGRQGGLVAEGRDIGTRVFPDADLKIFLTASVQERAHRRQQDLQSQGLPVPALAELEQAIQERDYRDSTRAISPLRKADDAIELPTDGLSIAAVVQHIVDLYHQITSDDEP